MLQPNDILLKLSPYKGEEETLVHNQSFPDIMRGLLKEHDLSAGEYDKMSTPWWQGNAIKTCKGIFDYCKKNMKYNEETAEEQTVRTPSAIIAEGRTVGVDCKHYSLFICGILDSLRRKGYPVECFYRFVAYPTSKNQNNTMPGHVFAVAICDKKIVFVDPVLELFDQRYPRYNKHIDKFPNDMALKRISGIGDAVGALPHYLDQPARGLISQHGLPYVAVGQLPNVYAGANGQPWMATVGKHHHFHLPHFRHGFNPFMPGVPMINPFHHGHHGHHSGLQAHADQLINKAGFPSLPGIGAKKKHHHKFKIKLPHIKIKPGQLFMKATMAPSRNSFLLLLKKNVFDMAVHMHERAYKRGLGGKFDKAWKHIGGNTNKLHTAIDQGVKNYNRNHSGAKQIHGIPNGATIGFPPAIAAAIVAAVPVVTAIASMLKSVGIDPNKIHKGATDATDDLAHAHNAKHQHANDDGSVDHEDEDGNVVTTKGHDNPDGSQTLEITKVHHADPSTDEGDGPETPHHLDAPGGPDGDPDDPGGNLPAPHGGATKAIDGAFDKISDFFGHNSSKMVAGVGIAIGAGIALKGLNGPKKGKTTSLILGGGIAAAWVGYYMYAKKHAAE